MMHELTLPADLENLQRIRDFVSEAAHAGGLSDRASYNLQLAVDEIATNIISYGYAAAPPGAHITVRAQLLDSAVRITLEDQGTPFDPTSKVTDGLNTIAEPLDKRAIGGLGIVLALSGVDQFEYRRINDTNVNMFAMRTS